jgi:thiosulfate/3-mercaptopyruvate sulfurtransferase
MTHPAQARDILGLMGFDHIYFLTDGLTGFLERCLKPVSLRAEPISHQVAEKVRQWRAYFYSQGPEGDTAKSPSLAPLLPSPGLVDTQWLADHLQDPRVKVIDCRKQPEYNTAHIPGAIAISVESFRGVVNGVPSVLMPADIIARKLSLMGITNQDAIVVVYGGDRFRDASLIGMALLRVGHNTFAILDGGFDRWASEKRPLTADLPTAGPSHYIVKHNADTFTVDYQVVLERMQQKNTLILDVRPEEYFFGEKSDEARPGHIPGAVNRPYKKDLAEDSLLPIPSLETAYANIIPKKTTPIIVHCRTGHQASQTFFVLKYLLGYENVFWYDASWTEWAARKELPAALSARQD